ncbi:hypothetical protein M3Y99_00485600 [Aphelenchoides fujianensis]|nr:hypothetical protein M3Y99_00485600 [Aphelenchoides fujianensis]
MLSAVRRQLMPSSLNSPLLRLIHADRNGAREVRTGRAGGPVGQPVAAQSDHAHQQSVQRAGNRYGHGRGPTRSMDGGRVVELDSAAIDAPRPQLRDHLHFARLQAAVHHVRLLKYVTCAADGQICLWDCVGGRAVDSTVQQYVHRMVVPYTNSLSDHHSQTRLFCIGDYADVIVLDAQDLNILYFFRSQLEPDWLCAITAVKPYDKPVVIGISVSGIIKMWSVEELEKKESSSVIFEEESKPLGIKEVRAISCSRFNTRMMLVIAPSSWQILDPCTLQQLIVSQCAIEAVNGTIIDIDKIAIGFADSTIVLFQLPRNRLCGRQVRDRFGEKPIPIGSIEHPFVFALLKGSMPKTTAPLLECQINFFFDSGSTDEDARKVAYRVDHQGSLSVWNIPKNFDALVEEFIRTRKPSVYEATTRQSFDEVWEKLNPPPPSIIAQEPNRTITATIFVGCQGKLLLGRDDGSIIMTYACHAIAAQLLDMPTTDIQQRLLVGHTAAVNCFLYPFEENQRYDPELFLSGGMDFAVVVWNIVTGSKLHRFCSQGGPIFRMVIPPDNCNPRILHCVCSIAGDNSAALLSLKENKCILLASRQQYPVVDVKWRPLDDFMLLKCEDNSVYVWQMETGNLDRIVAGILSVDVIEACQEQAGLAEYEDEAGASQAIQMLRAIKNKNVAAIRKVAAGDDKSGKTLLNSSSSILPPPMDVVQLKKCSNEAHLVLFNIDALITGLQVMDQELYAAANPNEQNLEIKPSFSANVVKRSDVQPAGQATAMSNGRVNGPATAQRWQMESNLYVDTARLLISLLHAWNLDESLDGICENKLKFYKPRVPLCFGSISRRGDRWMELTGFNRMLAGFISLYMPFCTGRLPALNDLTFRNFSRNIRWKMDRTLTTIHLLAIVSVSNTIMSLKSRVLHSVDQQRPLLRRVPSTRSNDSNSSDQETQAIRQGWSHLASMHCVLLPETIRPPDSYAAPQIELLARRWQDSCAEIRDASQALLIRELDRMTAVGRKQLIDYWGPFLPTLLDPALSIFGHRTTTTPHNVPTSATPQAFIPNHHQTLPPPIPPPIPPSPVLGNDANRAGPPSPSAASDPSEAAGSRPAAEAECRQKRQREHVVGSPLASGHLHRAASEQRERPLRRRAPSAPQSSHFDHRARRVRGGVSAGSAGLLGFDARHQPRAGRTPDVRRDAAAAALLAAATGGRRPDRAGLHRLAAAHRPPARSARPAGVDELRREVGPHGPSSPPALSVHDHARNGRVPNRPACALADRFFSGTSPHFRVEHGDRSLQRGCPASNHPAQRDQSALESACRSAEIDRTPVREAVGDILVHCLDMAQLKNRSLAELFPPIAKFNMISYCASTRRIAFGGKNGAIVVHDLRASKAQTIQAHKAAVTAVAFSQDGKYLAAYSSQDAQISFWQTQQAFLGMMGQSTIKCTKTYSAPSEFPVLSPGGSYQPFRARIVWINAKSLTLMLPNGKENRFTV